MRTVVTLTGLFGLLSLLSIAACGRLEGAPGEAAEGPDRVVTFQAPVAMQGSGDLPAMLSGYVSLHKIHHENVLVHGMAGMETCR